MLPACQYPFSVSAPTHVILSCPNTVWVDACAELGRFAIILISPTLSRVFALRLPPRFHGHKRQQAAELYACKAAVTKCSLFLPESSQVKLISDSVSSIFTLVKFSTKARHTLRGRLLRQVSKLVSQCRFRFFMGFIRSAANPADAPSRCLTNFNGPPSRACINQCNKALPLVVWSHQEDCTPPKYSPGLF